MASELHVMLELILNLALLVALTIVSGFIDKRWSRNTRSGVLAQGFLFGVVALLGMLRPLNFGPGLIFDGRSVMVGLCAVYFGPWATALAVLMLAVVRLGLGGVGAMTGILVILSSAAVGLAAYYRLVPGNRSPSTGQLYLLGLVIHVVMLALMLTLPDGAGWTVIRRIGAPVMVLYPLAMILAGKILSDQLDAGRILMQLRESEEKLRILIEGSPDPIFSFTREGKYTYVNPAFARGVGRQAREIVGRKIWDVFPKEEADRRFTALNWVFQTGRDKVIEVRVPRPDEDRYFVTTITPIKDAAGQTVSVICSSKDITERKQAEEALRQSESRFRLFTELAPVGIVISDREEKTIYVSPKFVEMFGYTLADIPSVREWWPLAYPDETIRAQARRDWEALIRRIKENGGGFEPLGFPVVCKDGTSKHVEFRLAVSGDLNVIVLVDVTERKLAEEKQAYSHDLLENLARLVPGVIYQYRLYPDGRSCFPWASPGMNLIYEVTPEEVREDATPVFGRLHPEDHDRVAEAIFESARTLRTFYCEFRVLLPRQGLRWRWSQAHPLRTEDGGTLWHGIISDITERKEAEQTREKLEGQLQQAMKMEAIGRLAGGIAHDFNNLLTGIMGNVQLAMLDLEAGDPLVQTLTEVARSAESAAALTRQLLAFSRKQLIEPKVIDLNELVSTLRKMLARLIGEDIELKTMSEKRLGAVKVDPGQFEQILVNLAVNARDAMPDGGKLLIETANLELDDDYCLTHPNAAPGSYVLLAVSDNGIGMSAAVKSRLFEPFFTTKPKGRGTGLGLATVYGAVKQAGGNVEVYSEEGKGTTFKIFLPRVLEKTEKFEKDRHASPMLGGNETVLLVEDEAIVRDLAVKVLTRLGYQVLQAADGGAAYAAAEKHRAPIHLLLTDVVLPNINGRQLSEQIRKLKPEIKVLFTSGYTENAIAHHGVIDAGVSFIGKPYTLEALAKKVRDTLDGK